jgi:SNF2 family DNA or RNA helicase
MSSSDTLTTLTTPHASAPGCALGAMGACGEEPDGLPAGGPASEPGPDVACAGGAVPSAAACPMVDAYRPLIARLTGDATVTEAHSLLVDEALAVWARPGFETLMCLPRLRFEPFEHQLDAASRVLRHMQGRAILADEVGLGKTIEAGIVLSELRLRGLAPRVLVLAPAGLVGQWREELERKFALPCVIASAPKFATPPPAVTSPVIVASLASARRDPLRSALVKDSWDLVIVDEAHRLKSPRSASARLGRSLRARYMLLLTATPIENRLSDLFQLVNIVRPGSLGAAAEFRRRHGAGDGRQAREVAALRLALREIMVRHRRSEIALTLPRRIAETVRVEPSAGEAELYRAISERVRAQARGAAPARALALRTVQQLAGSSLAACLPSLRKLGFADLLARAEAIEAAGGAGGKAATLIELLTRHRARDEKVIVFTAFRRTLEQLSALLERRGLPAFSYHGSLTRSEKDAAIAAFAGEAPILLSTEAAGEGRNLQFCHAMVNFDLPWNPMQIEQRLGRIHRIGQRHDVCLTNLVMSGTVEQRLLAVLQAKINLFELVVGELDMILGRVEDDLDFEGLVFREHVHSANDTELDGRLAAVGERLARARTAYAESRDRVDELAAA